MSLILTQAGLAAYAQADATGTKLQATHMAVGDGDGNAVAHTADSTQLVNEVWRGALQEITVAASGEVEFIAHIPITMGGWYIREIALYADATLLAVGAHPEIWKPAPESPDKVELEITAPVKFDNAEILNLTVDTTKVLASQEHVSRKIAGHDAAPDAHAGALAAFVDHLQDKNNPHDTPAGLPIGTYFSFVGTAPPPGALETNGSVLQRAAYPALWEHAQESGLLLSEENWQARAAVGDVPQFSDGDGSTTFRLPKITTYVSGPHGGHVVGDFAGDAIRNITGELSTYVYNSAEIKGPYDFTPTDTGLFQNGTGWTFERGTLSTDLSKSTPTADENRPKTVYLLSCIQAFNAVQNPAMLDASALAQGLADKVDRADIRDIWAGMIVEWESEDIPILSDGLPKGLELDGSVVSLETYPRLQVKYCGDAGNATAPAWYKCTADGTRDTSGDYMRLQDRRGEFARGWDHERGLDTGRDLSSSQIDSFQGHGHGPDGHPYIEQRVYGGSTSGRMVQLEDMPADYIDTSAYDTGYGTPRVAIETRPRNIATMYIVLI